MPENEVEVQENISETVTEESVGLLEVRKTGLKDILTVQAILCVLIAILFTALNIFNSDLAADIFEVYNEKSSVYGNIMDLVNAFIDFLGSTPNV
ncbi:MAG: hypothetical protein J1E40_10825 [Oscillospiraceae bacterium]|nr:hypothetical protein [Oscillospiraceae bacterium]